MRLIVTSIRLNNELPIPENTSLAAVENDFIPRDRGGVGIEKAYFLVLVFYSGLNYNVCKKILFMEGV